MARVKLRYIIGYPRLKSSYFEKGPLLRCFIKSNNALLIKRAMDELSVHLKLRFSR